MEEEMGEGIESFAEVDNKEEGEVMDTPDRSKENHKKAAATPVGKFEESPVFNFLNSLSPIKPVKSMHVTQTINPLTFASLPSVFTSPQVSSLRESRVLQRNQLLDLSKPEFSCTEGNTIDTNTLGEDTAKPLDGYQENLDPNAQIKEGVNQINQDKETTPCDWENLTRESSDLLIFESPNYTDSFKNSIDPGMGFYVTMENMHLMCAEVNETEHSSTLPGEEIEMIENDMIAGPSMTDLAEEIDYEHLPGYYRGMRKRCLVFEMSGARVKSLEQNLDSEESTLHQSDAITPSNDHKEVPMKSGNDSSFRMLPGIGLHLNALAMTPRDYKIVNHDFSATARLLIGPGSSVNFHPSNTSSQELLNNVVSVDSSGREIDSIENAVMPMDDGCQASEFVENEDVNQISPKKKRRRMEQAGDGEACKRCNCKKSKCLKLYCECFAAGVYCVEPCACVDCFNKPIHEDTVLTTRKQIESRNPLAFAPKVIDASALLAEAADDRSKTPASARHKRGCNCKKSGCLKKYCECYQGGVGCSINCRCDGCKNVFGRKEGMEVEVEEDEMDMNEKWALDGDELVQNIDAVPQETPQCPRRHKPPKSGFPQRQAKCGRQFKAVTEDEMPEFLQGGPPISSGIKSSSPNQKRVSLPRNAGMSSRKLILQSIPAFPSLVPDQ